MGHGREIGDRRFVLNDNNYIMIPRKCGITVGTNYDDLSTFFDSNYSNIKIPTSNADLLNVERTIESVGTEFPSHIPVKHKFYRPQYNGNNNAMSRYSAPDLLISFLIINEIPKSKRSVTVNGHRYELDTYSITISGILRQNVDVGLIIGQSIPVPQVDLIKIPISKSRNKVHTITADAASRFGIYVYGKENIFDIPIDELIGKIQLNLYKVIYDSMEQSLLTFRELSILTWFNKNMRPLTVDEFMDIMMEIERYADNYGNYEEDDHLITSIKDMDPDMYEYNNYGAVPGIYIDTGSLTIRDIMQFEMRLSFLMELIDKYIMDEYDPFLTYVSACRTTELSTGERREMANLSNTENFTHAAAKRKAASRKKRPGGKSRFTRKAEKEEE